MRKTGKTQEQKNTDKFIRQRLSSWRHGYSMRIILQIVLPCIVVLTVLYAQVAVINKQALRALGSFEAGYFYNPVQENYAPVTEVNYSEYIDTAMLGYEACCVRTPYKLKEYPAERIVLYGIDRNSYRNYNWKIIEGRGFSDDSTNEMLALKGSGAVGDTVSFYDEGREYELTVVGIVDFKYIIGTRISANPKDTGKMPGFRGITRFLREYKSSLLIEQSGEKSYIAHPECGLNKAAGFYGLFIDGSEKGKELKGFLSNEVIYDLSSFPYAITMNGGRFLLFAAFLVLVTMLALIIFLRKDIFYAVRRYAAEMKLWTVCGVDYDRAKNLFTEHITNLGNCGIALSGTVSVLFVNRNIYKIEICLVLLALILFLYNRAVKAYVKRLFHCYVGKTDAKPCDVSNAYPLMEEETVLDNILFPLLLRGMEEDEAKKSAGYFAGMLILHHIRHIKCKDITYREKQQVKIARALTDTRDYVSIKINWEYFSEEDAAKLKALLEKVSAIKAVKEEDGGK